MISAQTIASSSPLIKSKALSQVFNRWRLVADIFVQLALVYIVIIIVSSQLSLDHYKLLTEGTIRVSANSSTYKYILVVEITISSLILSDLMVDNISNFKRMFMRKGALLILLILILLLCSSIIIFFYAIPYRNFLIIQQFQEIRIMSIFCATSSYANYYSNSIWSKPILLIAIICSGCGFLAHNYCIKRGDHADMASLILLTISSSIFITLYIRWILHLRQHKMKHNSISNEAWKTSVYTTLYLCVLLVFWISNYVVHGYHRRLDESEVPDLLSYELSFVGFVLIQSINTKHMLKKEAIKYQDELEFKRMFVRYISHEVRTPLNTAIMGLQVLSEELLATESNTESKDSLETVAEVQKSCLIAVNVLNELLTFDKLEAGTLMLEKTEVNAFTLIEETVRPFQVQARQAGVHLLIVPQSHNSNLKRVVIHVDTNKIAQVIRNMVSNALKFTPRDGTVQVILTSLHNHKDKDGVVCDMVKIDVVDSGAGISLENQQRLFKEVVQFNPGKLQKGGGSGLGLYISHGIASMHNGGLTVYSAGEGKGSTFTLTLPCYVPVIGNDQGSVRCSSRARISPELQTQQSLHGDTYELSDPNSLGNMNIRRRSYGQREVMEVMEVHSVRTVISLKPQKRPSLQLLEVQRMPSGGDISLHHHHSNMSGVSSGYDDSSAVRSIKISDTSSVYYGGRRGSKIKTDVGLMSSLFMSSQQPINLTARFHLSTKTDHHSHRSNPENIAKHPSAQGSTPSTSPPQKLHHSLRKSVTEVSDSHKSTGFNLNGEVGDSKLGETNLENAIAEGLSNPTRSLSLRASSSLQQSANLKADILRAKRQLMLNMLIVDDSPSNRKMQCRLLKKRCGMCLEADDGQVALDLIKNSISITVSAASPPPRIDVVLMDGNMPNMDGREATRKMREAGYNGVIIGVTGDVASDDIDSFLDAGADAVLAKPLNIASFDLIINKFFESNSNNSNTNNNEEKV